MAIFAYPSLIAKCVYQLLIATCQQPIANRFLQIRSHSPPDQLRRCPVDEMRDEAIQMVPGFYFLRRLWRESERWNRDLIGSQKQRGTKGKPEPGFCPRH